VDSAAVHRQARELQRRFERFRRESLTMKLGGRGSGCDETVGRMCWRHDWNPDWEPDPPQPEVSEKRRELLASLSELNAIVPGDGWIMGQRVRYLVESQEWSAALDLARYQCASSASWCMALEGYALHRRGRILEAEMAFRGALRAMESGEAHDWSRPGVVPEPDALDWIAEGDSPHGEWADREALFWALSDPFGLVPGNERWTEHLARMTESRIMRRGRNAFGLSWGRDLEELLLRYGPEVGWERIAPAPGSSVEATIIGREDPRGRQFTPPARVLEKLPEVEEREWRLEEQRPREAYAPPAAPVLGVLESQVAAFRRGDSLLIVAYVGPDSASLPDAPPANWWRGPAPGPISPVRGLFLLRPGDAPAWRGRSLEGASGPVSATVPRGRHLASLESMIPDLHWGARERFAVGLEALPPGVVGLSDVLLLESDAPAPLDPEAAASLLYPGRRLRGDSEIRIGWEAYGLMPSAAPPVYRITLRSPSGPWPRRLAEWVGLSSRREPVRVEWRGPVPESPAPQFLTLDVALPYLEDGPYDLIVEMEAEGMEAVTSRIRVLVGPPSRFGGL
jgi:hypothetical protein